MAKSKAVVLKLESIDNCPEELKCFQLGKTFFSNDKFGILDELNLARLLKLKYWQTVREQYVGDFCLIKKA